MKRVTKKMPGTPIQLEVTYASGRKAVFGSIRAASRSLTGNGSDALSTTIRRRIHAGGGYVGNGTFVSAI